METDLYPSSCAVCGRKSESKQVYPANLDSGAFNPDVFSARRLPDQIHYRIVRCRTCGLLRSDPSASAETIERLYRESSFNYSEETENICWTYGRYLKKLENYGVNKGSILEIGCGSGFFLKEAARQGYVGLYGVEPGRSAVEMAEREHIRNIICDIMRPGLFRPGQFDVICMFQLLDHIRDPAALLRECFTVLKPAGLILCINHNIKAFSARLLKGRSPIIDIEHTYLFSPDTMEQIFKLCGFKVRSVGGVCNRYSLFYLTRLLPLPSLLKRAALSLLRINRIGRGSLSVPLGNFYLIAQKD